MAKRQRKPLEALPSPAEVPRLADGYLFEIASYKAEIDALNAEALRELASIQERYDKELLPLKTLFESSVTALMQTMKSNKHVLFDGTDVVRLAHGSLIRNKADKVTIPRDALAKCEELGFGEAVKTVKSLDRDVVEKWPDERLVLIGATRNPKEEFSYDLKKEAKPCQPA